MTFDEFKAQVEAQWPSPEPNIVYHPQDSLFEAVRYGTYTLLRICYVCEDSWPWSSHSVSREFGLDQYAIAKTLPSAKQELFMRMSEAIKNRQKVLEELA